MKESKKPPTVCILVSSDEPSGCWLLLIFNLVNPVFPSYDYQAYLVEYLFLDIRHFYMWNIQCLVGYIAWKQGSHPSVYLSICHTCKFYPTKHEFHMLKHILNAFHQIQKGCTAYKGPFSTYFLLFAMWQTKWVAEAALWWLLKKQKTLTARETKNFSCHLYKTNTSSFKNNWLNNKILSLLKCNVIHMRSSGRTSKRWLSGMAGQRMKRRISVSLSPHQLQEEQISGLRWCRTGREGGVLWRSLTWVTPSFFEGGSW